MSDELKTSAYDKLTPQRKLLVDAVLSNLEKGTGLWEQGWAGGGAPVSAITGKQYNGVNRIFLLLASMERGYSDNRWLTYKQMEDKGWHFKTDAEGKSPAKVRASPSNTSNFGIRKPNSPLTGIRWTA